MISSTEQYQHPLWQKKKYAIYERDGWTCRACKKDCYELAAQLHAHHLYRIRGLLLWEYDDESLVTLCKDCHDKVSDLYKIGGIIAFKILCGEIDPIDLNITVGNIGCNNYDNNTDLRYCGGHKETTNILNCDGIRYCGKCKKPIPKEPVCDCERCDPDYNGDNPFVLKCKKCDKSVIISF